MRGVSGISLDLLIDLESMKEGVRVLCALAQLSFHVLLMIYVIPKFNIYKTFFHSEIFIAISLTYFRSTKEIFCIFTMKFAEIEQDE